MEKLTQNILAGTDFSRASELAVDAAAVLARQNDAKVTLVHVFEATSFAPLVTDPATGELVIEEGIRAQLENKLRDLAQKRLRCPQVKTALVLSKSPADGICHYAEKHDIDLIVLATHGVTGLAHLLIGSVAERVVRHASCPVLTLRSRATD